MYICKVFLLFKHRTICIFIEKNNSALVAFLYSTQIIKYYLRDVIAKTRDLTLCT